MSDKPMQVTEAMQALQLDISQVTRTKSIMNPNQIQKLWNSTRAIYKYQRPAKGGGTWTYVKTSYVRKVLDSVFGFNWSFEIETTLGEAFEVAKMTNACVVKGVLRGRVFHEGQWVEIVKTQFGRAEVKWQMENAVDEQGRSIQRNGKPERVKKRDDYTGAPIPLDFGNDMKAATSDALKKCASLMGVAADVYEPDEFQEIEITGSDAANERAKTTAEKVKQARKIIKKQSTKVEKGKK